MHKKNNNSKKYKLTYSCFYQVSISYSTVLWSCLVELLAGLLNIYFYRIDSVWRKYLSPKSCFFFCLEFFIKMATRLLKISIRIFILIRWPTYIQFAQNEYFILILQYSYVEFKLFIASRKK